MGNLTEEQNNKATDFKESVILDKEFQSFIDTCDKILLQSNENETTTGTVAPIKPAAPGQTATPQQNQGPSNQDNVVDALKKMKMKMNSGQDVSNDLRTLLNTIK